MDKDMMNVRNDNQHQFGFWLIQTLMHVDEANFGTNSDVIRN
jgi:hypothetical protein